MKKVSIIIPCYNAEQCIDRCVTTLVGQTIGIENLELIFVNDASTDHTYEKLCEWEIKYPESIMVINCAENGKQGKARNIGLQYASADYIGFCDNDDEVELTMFEMLHKAAMFQESDLVVCRSKTHTLEKKTETQMGRTDAEDFYFTIENLQQRAAFLELDINRAIWNKLYRREMLTENHLSFPEGMIYDDICFSELVKHYARRVYILEEAMYHHIISNQSASYAADNWKDKLGYFDANVLLIEELRGRRLYDDFAEKYETNFMIEFTAVIRSFTYIYGYISPEIFKTMSDILWRLFPDIKENAAYQKIISRNPSGSVSLVLQCINREITKEDMQRIGIAVKKEQEGISGSTDQGKVYEYSYLVEMNGDEAAFERMNQLVLDSEEFTLYNRFYYWRQALRIGLRKKSIKDSKQLLDQLYHKIYQEYESACQDLLTPTYSEERDTNLIYVITLQFIGLDYPPTRTALERIEVLNLELHKQVKVINTRESMTELGKFPMYAPQVGSVNNSISGSKMYRYGGMEFSITQSENDMPEISEVRRILQQLREDKPDMILVIGNGSIVADLASKMIPVVNIPVIFSSVWIHQGQYTAIGRKLSENEIKSYFGQSELPVNIIESIFSFKLKEQKNHYNRKDLNLPENRFLLTVVGTRLHDEVDDDFIIMMQPLLKQGAFLVFVGVFKNYDMYCEKYAVLRNHSICLGYQEDILAVDELMDLYVNPKRLGGGYSIVEAFSKGVPGVTLRYGDIAAAAGDEFCVENYEQMRQMIERYMTDQAFYHTQAEKAKKRVTEVTDGVSALKYIMNEAHSRELWF